MAFPTTNLEARYEAALDTGHTNGEALTSIDDQSGNTRTLVTSTTQLPVYTTGVVNSQPCYRFDGSDDRAYTTSVTGISSSALTISVVASSGGAEGTSRQWLFALYNGTTHILAVVEGATSGEWGSFARTSAGTIQQATSGVSTLSWCVLTLVWDGTTVYMYRNGTLVDSDALGGTFTVAGISIGRLETVAGEAFAGDIAMAAVWDTALNATARADLHSYVQDTYGITVSDYAGGGGTSITPHMMHYARLRRTH